MITIVFYKLQTFKTIINVYSLIFADFKRFKTRSEFIRSTCKLL